MAQMNSQRVSRLQGLQMEDLGLARRDYISTADDKPKVRVPLINLEACRASNQPGSSSQKLAQDNQVQINSWKNAWKTMEGQADGEDLAPMLDGQSHRFNLMQTINADGGQNYDLEPTTGRMGRHSVSAPTRGRGGGVIGTRGRGWLPEKSNASKKKKKGPAASMVTKAHAPPAQPKATVSAVPKAPRAMTANVPPIAPAPAPARTRAVVTRRRVPIAPLMRSHELVDSNSFMEAVLARPTIQAPSKPATITEMEKGHVVTEENRQSKPPLTDESEEEGEIIEKPHTSKRAGTEMPTDNPLPERRILGLINVFWGPSVQKESCADTLNLKVNQGFGSSLPQPGLSSRNGRSGMNTPQPDSHRGTLIELSPPSPAVKSESPATRKPNVLQKELAELTEAISKLSLLPLASKCLEDRINAVEEKLYIEGTRPLPAAGKAFEEHVKPLPLAKKVSEEYVKPSPVAKEALEQHVNPVAEKASEELIKPLPVAKRVLEEYVKPPPVAQKASEEQINPADEIGLKKYVKPLPIAKKAPEEPTKPLPVVRKAFEERANPTTEKAPKGYVKPLATDNIFGDHLLPGRKGNEDPGPILRTAPFEKPFAVPQKVNANAPNPMPKYGSQLKMRETPYLPQSAVAMQYAGYIASTSAPKGPATKHDLDQPGKTSNGLDASMWATKSEDKTSGLMDSKWAPRK